MPFQLPPLPYAFDALEPYIDAKTMEVHHDGHHAKYVAELNQAVAGHPELAHKSVEELLCGLAQIPEPLRTTIRNNGGGHFNHSLFWTIMTKGGQAGLKKGALSAAIDKQFGSFEQFKKEFSERAAKLFGSGWVWLYLNDQGVLTLAQSPNQDSPMMMGLEPIMGLDVWEHAYYLKYMNKRASYIDAWWAVVNWSHIDERYGHIVK